jgi:formate-nitrite transporter family protein
MAFDHHPSSNQAEGLSSKTERGKERTREEREYVPVIIKRNDEGVRHPDDVLEYAIAEGLEQIRRPPFSLFLSAVAAGLMLAFTVMAVAVMATVVMDVDNALLRRLATAVVYPLGFIIVIMAGVELFTEHTATAVYPILDRRSGLRSLLRLWFLVGLGNIVGAFFGALLLTAAEEVIQARQGYAIIGHHLFDFSAPSLFVSALLAGWIMAMGAWLTPGHPTPHQPDAVYLHRHLFNRDRRFASFDCRKRGSFYSLAYGRPVYHFPGVALHCFGSDRKPGGRQPVYSGAQLRPYPPDAGR